jgi:hypothetical protein
MERTKWMKSTLPALHTARNCSAPNALPHCSKTWSRSSVSGVVIADANFLRASSNCSASAGSVGSSVAPVYSADQSCLSQSQYWLPLTRPVGPCERERGGTESESVASQHRPQRQPPMIDTAREESYDRTISIVTSVQKYMPMIHRGRWCRIGMWWPSLWKFWSMPPIPECMCLCTHRQERSGEPA